ncbi:nucleoside triphosphate hydrolase [Rubellimicrobium sp. CFH 75288]|uniref:nucleoside triphosphate hydrolase n=1 Tax=Rubellimicrobium sp. CFH 75288 TaxID=2697034 RepID=UPI001411FA70|nr:nucleoside triphosphate hydrolase [Rubellimicrobium sp. CFH 75288]NAZ35468.1 nucleoside/nucleotide kinase family protein [Rubellimicrobium sp. CFH 75288]
MTEPVDEAELARRLAERAATGGRMICAIAGPPGSGKSTLAEALVARLNAQAPGTAALLPMDGFHYDDTWLIPAGLRPRKGAPETFDVAGLRHVLGRLRAGEDGVFVPVFDRTLEIARAGARPIPAAARVIVCEGNWLLLDREPWSGLRPFFDLTAMIEVPEATLRDRLRRRWEGYGLSEDEIAWKLDGNDLPNGRLVARASVPADVVLRQDG